MDSEFAQMRLEAGSPAAPHSSVRFPRDARRGRALFPRQFSSPSPTRRHHTPHHRVFATSHSSTTALLFTATKFRRRNSLGLRTTSVSLRTRRHQHLRTATHHYPHPHHHHHHHHRLRTITHRRHRPRRCTGETHHIRRLRTTGHLENHRRRRRRRRTHTPEPLNKVLCRGVQCGVPISVVASGRGERAVQARVRSPLLNTSFELLSQLSPVPKMHNPSSVFGFVQISDGLRGSVRSLRAR